MAEARGLPEQHHAEPLIRQMEAKDRRSFDRRRPELVDAGGDLRQVLVAR